jgi:phosphatidylserine decarboxylase
MDSPETPRDQDPPSLLDHLRVWSQYLLPQRYLSSLMHGLTQIRARPWKDWQIRLFARFYGVDMSQTVEPDLASYPDFNSFFTRALRPEARPLPAEAHILVAPADGRLMAFGRIEDGRLLQAKGRWFSLQSLLGGDPEWANTFRDGEFATVYLSPRDYHRVHMPAAGRLIEMRYVPGRLFSVSVSMSRLVDGLFARNERLITWFETAFGPMAVILVGALFVGGIETVWADRITPPHARSPRSWRYPQDTGQAPELQRGAELGRFNMGSTVITLLPADTLSWSSELAPGRHLRMGEVLGRLGRGRVPPPPPTD